MCVRIQSFVSHQGGKQRMKRRVHFLVGVRRSTRPERLYTSITLATYIASVWTVISKAGVNIER